MSDMNDYHRPLLLIHPPGELARYTFNLLDEIGFQKILVAHDVEGAKRLWVEAISLRTPFETLICNDQTAGELRAWCKTLSLPTMLVLSDAHSKEKLQWAAWLDINRLVYRPYGLDELKRALQKLAV